MTASTKAQPGVEQPAAKSPSNRIRVLIVEVHALFRESVARLLSAEPDFDVVAKCGAIDEAIELIRAVEVDVVLVDYDSPECRRPDFLKQLESVRFAGKVLILTEGLSGFASASLMSQGASGIFMKASSVSLLSEGIRQVASGRVWLDWQSLQGMCNAEVVPAAGSSEVETRFSEHERRVLSHLANGLTNAEIARRLSVTEASVKAAVRKIFAKTGSRTRSQVVRLAVERQWDEQQCG